MSRGDERNPGPRDPAAAGYYGVPVIHGPHWRWLIAAYFYFGGISGASAMISAYARLFGGARADRLARTASLVALATLLPCPVFLILDLRRPRRFLNMLLVFRPSSPMSIGSWSLAIFGGFLTLDVGVQLLFMCAGKVRRETQRVNPGASRALAFFSGTSGMIVAGYTGALLAATAVPLWSKRPELLSALFLSSAMTSGAAAVTATSLLKPADGEIDPALELLEVFAAAGEGALLVGWLASLGPTAKPLDQGLLGYVVRHGGGGAGIAAPLVIHAAARRMPRRARRIANLLGAAMALAGGFALRFAIVEGGRLSSDDPEAVIALTR